MRCPLPGLRSLVRTAGWTLLWLAVVPAAGSELLRALPPGQLPDDRRLGPLLNLNGYFPFTPSPSREAWSQRAEQLHRQLLVATGLWPMPAGTPAHAVIHGRVEREGYTAEKVYLESYPGHFVTGNLYRPKQARGRLPGVLCPHGHWPNGRFYDAGAKAIRESLVAGAERFETSGRYPLQARCVQLARMGCLVFHYDMVGYADSLQLTHRPGVRPELNMPENWGYFSPQAEARLQTMMGLQTYNSIRVLDWFSQLPEIDPQRIGVTGASGGGTQTFILAAIDPRPAVAFPAVMVSTAMQGGCTCENASYLRTGTGNVEIAALIAPRPLGMTAADDWTKEIATKGLPELKQHYKMLGVPSLVMARPLVQFPHNYNYVSRAVMYGWMNKHLKLGLPEPIVEEDFRPLSIAEMSVWDASHPRPPSGDAYERSLLKWITADSRRQMESLVPHDGPSLTEFRKVLGGAIDVLIGRRLPPAGAISVSAGQKTSALGDWPIQTMLLRNSVQHEELPLAVLRPRAWNGAAAVVWVSREGKQSLLDESGHPRPAIARLIEAGRAVIGLDLMGQGEFTPDGKPLARARLNSSGRDHWAQYAGFTFGYNYPLFAQRVHDILSAVSYAHDGLSAKRVSVVGLGGAGHWVAAARAQAGAAIDRAVVDTGGFRFARLTAIDDPDFLPGGAKYLDLPGILALSAPQPLWLAGEGRTPPPVVAAAYQATGQGENLTCFSGQPDKQPSAAITWLLQSGP